MSPNHQGVFLNTTDNLNGSYLDEGSLRKRGRYGSMPALNSDSPNTRRVPRLYSDRGAGSPVLNQKLPVCHSKRIDGASSFRK
ncbi:hypothetical protein DPMN_094071 [Dreissena polymorpha]|uniref:Uncharacterized protein n=1 Tax=Dreissena polymorpha TaxID=45954 RepID=A0A9D4L5B1_DREPO|nr:hypothetical protein DPMN_094071 [Dreissena polymorpha]